MAVYVHPALHSDTFHDSVLNDWGNLQMSHAMTNVIKHSSGPRQFHGAVGAALMHVNRTRQTDGRNKAHRRFSDKANPPKNVTKTQMVTM